MQTVSVWDPSADDGSGACILVDAETDAEALEALRAATPKLTIYNVADLASEQPMSLADALTPATAAATHDAAARKRDVPLRLSSSTPATLPGGRSRRGRASGALEGEPLVHSSVPQDDEPLAPLEGEGRAAGGGGPSAGKRRWQRLRQALRGRLRLGRSGERFGGHPVCEEHEPLVEDGGEEGLL